MQSEVPSESIYDIIPPVEETPLKPKMHRSCHSGTLPPTGSTFGCARTSRPGVHNLAGHTVEEKGGKHSYVKPAADFGPPPGSLKPDPADFQKCEAGAQKVPGLKEMRKLHPEVLAHRSPESKKTGAPKATDPPPVMNLVTAKNFVVSNAVDAILMAPKKPLGPPKDYLKKMDYGKVPQYMKKIKNDIAMEYEYIRNLQTQEDEAERAKVRLLTEDEKGALIHGLKAKWEQVNTDYQASTHLTKLDTIGKVKRKEAYEAQLMQVEKDIKQLSRKYIFVDTTE